MYLVTSGLITYLPQSRIVISASLTFCENNGDKLVPRTQQMANNTAYWWYVISGLFSKYELTVNSVSTSNQIYDLFSSHIKRCFSHMSMKVVVLERSTWVWVQILRRYYTRHLAWMLLSMSSAVATIELMDCFKWSAEKSIRERL